MNAFIKFNINNNILPLRYIEFNINCNNQIITFNEITY